MSFGPERIRIQDKLEGFASGVDRRPPLPWFGNRLRRQHEWRISTLRGEGPGVVLEGSWAALAGGTVPFSSKAIWSVMICYDCFILYLFLFLSLFLCKSGKRFMNNMLDLVMKGGLSWCLDAACASTSRSLKWLMKSLTSYTVNLGPAKRKTRRF